jgi:hypothetical protein
VNVIRRAAFSVTLGAVIALAGAGAPAPLAGASVEAPVAGSASVVAAASAVSVVSICPDQYFAERGKPPQRLSKVERRVVRSAEQQMAAMVNLVLGDEPIDAHVTAVFPELHGEVLFKSHPELEALWSKATPADRRRLRPLLNVWLARTYGVALVAARDILRQRVSAPLLRLADLPSRKDILELFESVLGFFGREPQLSKILNFLETEKLTPQCLKTMALKPVVKASLAARPERTSKDPELYAVELWLHPVLTLNPRLPLVDADRTSAKIVATLRRSVKSGQFHIVNLRSDLITLDLRSVAVRTRQEETLSVFARYRREGVEETQLLPRLSAELERLFGEVR